VISMLEFLTDNIFVSFGGTLFQQIVGIPMGTNCVPLLADLFVYSYESEFLWPLSSNSRYRSKNNADEAVSVVSLIYSSGGYINGRNSASLGLLIDKTSSIYLYVKLKHIHQQRSSSMRTQWIYDSPFTRCHYHVVNGWSFIYQ
jgi:hypothetical protein